MSKSNACALTNVYSVLAGENGAQLQVWRNIKTQLRADKELVMQKREGKERRAAKGRRRMEGGRLRYEGNRQIQTRTVLLAVTIREAGWKVKKKKQFCRYLTPC